MGHIKATLTSPFRLSFFILSSRHFLHITNKQLFYTRTSKLHHPTSSTPPIFTMSNKNITLSAREMEVLALAWQCMEAQPKVCTPSSFNTP